MIIGILSTILLFSLLIAIPQKYSEKIPHYFIPAAYTGIIAFLLEKLQGKLIKDHITRDGGVHSGWRAAKIGLVGLCITLIFIFGYSFALSSFSPEMEGKVINLKELRGKVFYDGLSDEEATEIANTLKKLDYFDPNEAVFLKIEKQNDGYRFLIPMPKKAWTSPELLGFLLVKKAELEDLYPTKQISIFLFEDGFRGREKTLIDYKGSYLYSWVKHPLSPESDSLILQRLIIQLSFWKAFFEFGISNNEAYMSWGGIPTPIRFASNGIGAMDQDRISQNWIYTFYDKESALKAYNWLNFSFHGLHWEENKLVYKSYISALNGMISNLKGFQNSLSSIKKETADPLKNN